MSDFPTLSVAPQECPEEPIDNTIRSASSEVGYVQSRPRYTRQKYTFGPIKYILSDADFASLKTHDETVTGAVIFNWTHPVSGTVYQVRYSKRYKETPVNIGGKYLHGIEFTLESV